jgi:hypothetical protein
MIGMLDNNNYPNKITQKILKDFIKNKYEKIEK